MRFISELTERFGYSGHAIGPYDAIAAIANGARIIEKHFTIDQKLPFRDNKYSILPDSLKIIKEFADAFYLMNTDRGLDFQQDELQVRKEYARRWQE